MKDRLRAIIRDDGKVPEGTEPYGFSLELLELLGDTDSELRDDLAMTVLYHWIISGTLSDGEVRHLSAVALNGDHLFRGIGDMDDRVFMRTFSALVIATVLKRHRDRPFLSQAEIEYIFERFLIYYRNDVDVRGFVGEKGWAHGAAHGADVLMHFAQMDEIGTAGYRELLNVVFLKATIDYYGYGHEEYERMNNAVVALVEGRRLPEEDFMEWIDRFGAIRLLNRYPEKIVQRSNISHFLRSLYFRLYGQTAHQRLLERILAQIDHWNHYR